MEKNHIAKIHRKLGKNHTYRIVAIDRFANSIAFDVRGASNEKSARAAAEIEAYGGDYTGAISVKRVPWKTLLKEAREAQAAGQNPDSTLDLHYASVDWRSCAVGEVLLPAPHIPSCDIHDAIAEKAPEIFEAGIKFSGQIERGQFLRAEKTRERIANLLNEDRLNAIRGKLDPLGIFK